MADRFDSRAPTLLPIALLATWLALPTGAAPAGPGQERFEPQERASQQERALPAAENAKDLKRVLHLADGQTLRARTRFVDDHWEYRRGANWIPLPTGLVERVALEKELLAQARRLERELDADDPVRRVAYAEWLHSSGLRTESIEELDQVLRRHPDQPTALAHIARSSYPLNLPALDGSNQELPAQVDALLRFGAGSGPVVRELCVLALAQIAGRYPLQAELAKHLHNTSPRRRSFCALALRRLYPGQELEGLLVRAILDGSESVRFDASLGLKAVADPVVILPVLNALESQHPVVRTHAAQALGNMGYPEAVAALISRLNVPLQGSATRGASPRAHIFIGKQFAYIQDFDVEVAQFQAVADPVINVLIEGAVLDARVQSVRNETVVVERSAIRSALQQLTGAKPGTSVDSWNRWWEEHRHDYLGGEQTAKSSGSSEAR